MTLGPKRERRRGRAACPGPRPVPAAASPAHSPPQVPVSGPACTLGRGHRLHRILQAAEHMQWTLAVAYLSLTLEDGPPSSPPANTRVSLGKQQQMEHG